MHQLPGAPNVVAMRRHLALAATAAVWLAALGTWAVLLAPSPGAVAGATTAPSIGPDHVPPATAPAAAPPAIPAPPANPAPVAPAPKPSAPELAPVASSPPPSPPPSPCDAARARSRVPLAAGWSESCTPLPGETAAGRAVSAQMTLRYSAAWIDAHVRRLARAAWDYIVAHERCHALTYGTPAFLDEEAADACAARYGAPAPAR